MIRRVLSSSLCIILAAPLLVAQQTATTSDPANVSATNVIFPKGTKVQLVLLESISTETAVHGSPVRFAVAKDVVVNGATVIHAGAPASGVVKKAIRGVAYQQWPELKVSLKEIKVANQVSLPLTRRDPNNRRGTLATLGTLVEWGVFCAVLLPYCIAVTRGMNAALGGPDDAPTGPNPRDELTAEMGRQINVPRCTTFELWVKSSKKLPGGTLDQFQKGDPISLGISCPQLVVSPGAGFLITK
jgi:hypothetical protein